MFKVFLTGNLTEDPKTGTSKNGKQVCNFRLAPRNAKYFNKMAANDEGKQLYVQISAWGKLGENCARFLTKGRTVTVVADCPEFVVYKSEKYGDARLSMQMNALDVEFGNNATRPPVPEGAMEEKKPEQAKGYVPEGFVEVDAGDLPF